MSVIDMASRRKAEQRTEALPRSLTAQQTRDIAIGIFAGAFTGTREAAGVALGQGADHTLQWVWAQQLLCCLAEHQLHVMYAPTHTPIHSVEAQLVLIEALADLRHAIKRQAVPAEIEAARHAHDTALADYLGATRREFGA